LKYGFSKMIVEDSMFDNLRLQYSVLQMNFRLIFVALQVAKREKLAKLEEEEAVQIAMESELNKTIYITGAKPLSSYV
jgi:hypothetical protein